MYVEHLRYLSYEKVNETVTLSFASLSEDPDTLSCFGGDGVYFVCGITGARSVTPCTLNVLSMCSLPCTNHYCSEVTMTFIQRSHDLS